MKSAFLKKRKDAVYSRDCGRCQYCGIHIAERPLATVDHIIPVSLGGSFDLDNLRLSCRSCNSTKQDRSVEWLRMFRALSLTKYASVITLSQYHQLLGIGAGLDPLPVVTFHYEERQ